MMTGHCNGGCQVGWTGAMCEKGYHLTIHNNIKQSVVLKLYALVQLIAIYDIIISWIINYFVWFKKYI